MKKSGVANYSLKIGHFKFGEIGLDRFLFPVLNRVRNEENNLETRHLVSYRGQKILGSDTLGFYTILLLGGGVP